MRCSFPLFLVLVSCVSAQQQPTTEIITITPDTVVAIVNGQKFTAGDLERITQGVNPQLRALAASKPQAFLEQYAESLTLAAEAEKAKLDQVTPYREQIADARKQILAQALVKQQGTVIEVSPEEIKKHFEEHREDYKHAVAKVIFVSRIAQITNLEDGKVQKVTPEEISAKVEKVTKLARDGGDFVKLAKEHSDDRATAEKEADLPYPVRANDANIPLNMRKALVAAKPGDIVGPIEHQTGYYLFRVDSVETPAMESVAKDLEKDLKNAKLQQWLDDMRAKSTVTLQNDAFWKTFEAANQPQQPKPEAEPTAKPEAATGK